MFPLYFFKRVWSIVLITMLSIVSIILIDGPCFIIITCMRPSKKSQKSENESAFPLKLGNGTAPIEQSHRLNSIWTERPYQGKLLDEKVTTDTLSV